MARRPRLFAPGVLYHAIVRGNQRQNTFHDRRDYETYLKRLGKYREKFDYLVHAYCLMPNHLLLESSEQPLSKFMQGLQQSYSQYFNLRHGTVGHVFQGRYKAIICEKDDYLLQLIRYIHLNPVRAGMVRRPEEYRFSGHRGYLRSKRDQVMDPAKALELFGGPGGYGRFVLGALAEGHQDGYYEVEDQRFLGSEGFGDRMQARAGTEQKRTTNTKLEAVVQQLAADLKVEIPLLRGPDRSWAVSRARTMIAYVLTRRMGYALHEVAGYLRRDPATVGTLTARLSDRTRSDRRLWENLEKLGNIVES